MSDTKPVEQRIAEIRARLEAATPGPWRVVMRSYSVNEAGRKEFGPGWQYPSAPQVETAWIHGHILAPLSIPWDTASPYREEPHSHAYSPADAAFIANAPSDMEWLLDQLSSIPSQIEAAVKTEREAIISMIDKMLGESPVIRESMLAAAIRSRGEAVK